MKQITTSKGSYIFVPIVKDSEHITVDDGDLCYLPPVPKGYSVSTMQYIELPKDNNYTFLCTTDTITEDMFENINIEDFYLHTEAGDDLYKDFKKDTYIFDIDFYISLKSFLQSHNLSPDKTYAICQKNQN